MLVLEMQTSRSNSSCLLVAYILLKKTHKLAKIEMKISQRSFMSMHRTLWELRRANSTVFLDYRVQLNSTVLLDYRVQGWAVLLMMRDYAGEKLEEKLWVEYTSSKFVC